MIIKIYNIIFLIRSKLYYLIFFLLFASVTDFFRNFNILLSNDYNKRILISYNYCEGISYGYINKIKNKYLLNNKKIYIINFQSYPTSINLFYDVQLDNKKNNLILLNFKKNNQNILNNNGVNLSDYTLLDTDDNCYYYQKKN